jgi:hypothetical protein
MLGLPGIVSDLIVSRNKKGLDLFSKPFLIIDRSSPLIHRLSEQPVVCAMKIMPGHELQRRFSFLNRSTTYFLWDHGLRP